MTPQEYASTLVTIKMLKDKLDVLDKTARAHWRDYLGAGDRKSTVVGSVTITHPKPSWRVVDLPAYHAWVRVNAPTELYTVEAVNSAWESSVLARGGVVDEATGEVVPVPGTALRDGTPVVQVRPAAGAEEYIAAELAAMKVTAAELLTRLDVRAVTS